MGPPRRNVWLTGRAACTDCQPSMALRPFGLDKGCTTRKRVRNESGIGFHMRGTAIRIIGTDPGWRRTGWGIVESDGVRLSYVGSGLLTSTADADLAYRLRELFEGIASVISSFKPHEAAVEE